MNFEPSAKSRDVLERVQQFMRDEIVPIEARYWEEMRAANPDGDWTKWKVLPRVEALKDKARRAGLWNLFLPEVSGLSTLEYAPIAEATGRSERFEIDAYKKR